MLDNAGDLLSYILKEDSKYDNSSTNTSKTTLIKDSYSDDIKEVATYLNSIYIPVNTTTNNYKNISDIINNPGNVDTSFIVQVRSGGYLRYMNVLAMDDNTITLKTPKRVLSFDKVTFETSLMYGDSLNVISFSSKQNSSIVLSDIVQFQSQKLNDKSHNCDQWLSILTSSYGSILSSVIFASIWKLYDYFKSPQQVIGAANSAFTVTEQNRLLNDALTNYNKPFLKRLVIDIRETAFAFWNDYPRSTKIAIMVVISGMVLMLTSALLVGSENKYKSDIENDKTNLNTY